MTSRGLAPPDVHAQARPRSRLGVAFGERCLILLAIGTLWLLPAIFSPRLAYATVVWDALVVGAWLVDLRRLPAASTLSVARMWPTPVALSTESEVCLRVTNTSQRFVRARLTDTVPFELRPEPPSVEMTIPPGAEASRTYMIRPRERGRIQCGNVHLRYQTGWGLAERWAVAALPQRVPIYPNLDEARRESIHLSKIRREELRHRSRAVRGAGRVFESLREYQDGDEPRDICWTASARRARLVTRRYEIERNQTIWVVMDTGRLMRTRVGDVTKLDLAVNAALALAQIGLGAGDRVGLLAYSRGIDHYLPASRGGTHLRAIVEHLTDVEAHRGEAEHLLAAARLLSDQTRRSLIVWFTDVPDGVMTPEVVLGASQLTRTHLVLFMVVGQPDLRAAASESPGSVDAMFRTAAAQEIVHRREVVLSGLRTRGAMAMEVGHHLSTRLVNTYLEIKQTGRL